MRNDKKFACACLITMGALVANTCSLAPKAAADDTGLILLAQDSGGPPLAPSFAKQAGKILFDNAQKQVLKSINARLQSPESNQQNGTQFPVNGTQVPISGTQVPISGTQVPISGTQVPISGTQVPISGTQVPISGTQVPISGTQVPTNGSQTNGSVQSSNTVPATPAPRLAPPCRSWVDPAEPPIACLVCVHGLGLQSNSYEFLGKELSRRGIAVYAIDVRGFGSWINAKGKGKINFDDCLLDIRLTLEAVKAANPALPTYVLGESMGGAIALRAASLYPKLVDGLISSVPAGERFNQGKTSAQVFLNLLAGANLTNVGDQILNQATKNAKLKAQWSGDPLSRLNLTPQELIQFQDFMNGNHDAARKVGAMPVLFVQGIGDQLVKPEGTWELFNSVASKDKSFFAVPGEHLIFEEAQTQDAGLRDQNFRVISAWLSNKVGRRRNWQGHPATSIPQPGGVSNSGSLQTAAAGSGTMQGALNLSRQQMLLSNGQAAQAAYELEQLQVQYPNRPEILELLGRAYYQSGDTNKAGLYMRSAMRAERSGGERAQAYNNYLLNLSRDAVNGGRTNVMQTAATVAPWLGFGNWIGIAQNALGILQSGSNTTVANMPPTQPLSPAVNANAVIPKGKVYAFYANWADQCRGMSDLLNKLSYLYGNVVEINRVNIEETSSERLMEQFKVGPIPTVVFVTPSGQVRSTIIGESTLENYEQAVKALAGQAEPH